MVGSYLKKRGAGYIKHTILPTRKMRALSPHDESAMAAAQATLKRKGPTAKGRAFWCN
jgi:hypothetical protein